MSVFFQYCVAPMLMFYEVIRLKVQSNLPVYGGRNVVISQGIYMIVVLT